MNQEGGGELLLDLVPVAHPTNTFFDLFGLVFVEVIAGDTLEALLHNGFARFGRGVPVASGVFSA